MTSSMHWDQQGVVASNKAPGCEGQPSTKGCDTAMVTVNAAATHSHPQAAAAMLAQPRLRADALCAGAGAAAAAVASAGRCLCARFLHFKPQRP